MRRPPLHGSEQFRRPLRITGVERHDGTADDTIGQPRRDLPASHLRDGSSQLQACRDVIATRSRYERP